MPNPTISSLTLPVKDTTTGVVTNVTYDLPSGGGSTYTAGDGIDITNDEISVDPMPAADMSEVIYPLPSRRNGSVIYKQVLSAGSTTVTFTNLPTTGEYIADFFTSTGINYTAINASTAGQVTLTYDAQSSNVNVYCKLEEVF